VIQEEKDSFSEKKNLVRKNMPYKPSQKDLDKILISLSAHCHNELALPGNWSPTLFRDDLTNHQVATKDFLCKTFTSAMTEGWTYRKFFEESRGKPRDVPCPEVWDIFDRGQLMMAGESLFLQLISNPTYPEEDKKNLFLYLTEMGTQHVSEWNSTVKNAGACCWEFFLKDPWSYMALVREGGKTDFNFLADLKMELSPIPYPNRIDTSMSRQELIQIFETLSLNERNI
jgi:hypothetical protein